MVTMGTLASPSISKNDHYIGTNLYNVYQFWCFYQKVHNRFGKLRATVNGRNGNGGGNGKVK